MKIVHIAVPAALMLAFVLAWPTLLDRSELEHQRRSLAARAASYDPTREPLVKDFGYGPPRGAMRDERAAFAVAEAVWTGIYGPKTIALEKPFLAFEANGRWHVEGTFPRDWHGGVAYIIIAKDDGRIIKVWHTK